MRGKHTAWGIEKAEATLETMERQLVWAEEYVGRLREEIAKLKQHIQDMKEGKVAPKKVEYPRYRFGM
jgi:cell division protein FtsB